MSKARDIASASPAPSTVSATELGYLDGVSSAIQTQIDSKIGSASAINPTIVDAKGDIIAATAADTVARLAVGSNDQVLTADSSTATGLKWAAPTSGGMTLLSTTTLTGTSITVSNISQSYNNLYLLIENVYPAADTYLYMTVNSDTTTANYQASLIGLRGGSMAFRPDNKPLTAYGLDSGTARANLITATLYNYAGSTFKTWSTYASCWGDDASPYMINSFGNTIWYGTDAISSLTFTMSGGASSFSAGTVKIYGVK